jgi:uncharacterized OsmC-like protein
MNAEKLREAQAPLKQTYRQDPQKAVVRLKSHGELLPDRIACSVQTSYGKVFSALHRAAGGDEDSACSGDMLLDALVACTGVTVCAVAAALGVSLHGGSIEAEADLDFRGTLGVDRQTPVGIRHIDVKVRLDSDASDEQKQKLLQLVERYCVIYQTLVHPPSIRVQSV